jgi:hypothetical protein
MEGEGMNRRSFLGVCGVALVLPRIVLAKEFFPYPGPDLPDDAEWYTVQNITLYGRGDYNDKHLALFEMFVEPNSRYPVLRFGVSTFGGLVRWFAHDSPEQLNFVHGQRMRVACPDPQVDWDIMLTTQNEIWTVGREGGEYKSYRKPKMIMP